MNRIQPTVPHRTPASIARYYITPANWIVIVCAACRPMASYASFPIAPMPQNPQQPAAAAQTTAQWGQQQYQQQYYQTGAQLGAGYVAQPVGLPGPGGHYHSYHCPEADLAYLFLPPQVLRPLITRPSANLHTASLPLRLIAHSLLLARDSSLLSCSLARPHLRSRCARIWQLAASRACVHFADSLRDAQRQI